MDSTGNKPRGAENPARPAPATDATQQQPAARAALETPPALSDGGSAAADQVDDGQPDVASVDESHGAEEEEDNRDDDDDEQVERFYALLANIRAMRGLTSPHNMLVASSSFFAADTHTDTAGDSARTKRLRRSAEPPWRPSFRMEDFDEPPPTAASSSCKIRKLTTRGAGHDDLGHGGSSGSAPPTSVAVVASSSMPHAAVRLPQFDSSRD